MNVVEVLAWAGFALLIIGMRLKKRKNQTLLMIIGAGALMAYSIYLKSAVFIVLQAVFILNGLEIICGLNLEEKIRKIFRKTKP